MTSFIKDRNNKIDYRNGKKLNLKSLCITKIPESVSFDEVKEVCSTYGQIHTVHETVKNCTYSFINFEFLENEDEVINALLEIGVEARKGQRKQESFPTSKKQHLLHADDLEILDQVAKQFNQKKLETLEDWNDDSYGAVDCEESVTSSSGKVGRASDSLNSSLSRKDERLEIKQSQSLVPASSPCVLCKEDACLVCLKCGDYYCSKECQKSDWPSHRYICFAIPDLVSPSQRSNQSSLSISAVQKIQKPSTIITELQKPDEQVSFKKFQIIAKPTPEPTKTQNVKTDVEIEVYPNMPAAGDFVNIVSVFNSRHVYIRSLEPAADKQFRVNLYNINKLCKTARPIQSLPAPKSYACTDYQGDGLFYRVRVVKAEDLNNITVRYVDFGNVEKKTFKDLRQLPEECKEFKIFKIAVTLNDIPATLDSNKKMLNYLQRISDDVTNKYKIFYENDRAVLLDAFSGESLNKQLLDLINFKQQIKDKEIEKEELSSGRGSGSSDSSSNESLDTVKGIQKMSVMERVMEPPFTFEYLTVGDDVPVIIVDNSLLEHGCFSCCLEKNASGIERISKKSQWYADKDSHHYIPIEREYILVRYSDDSEWYRAQVSAVVEDEKDTFEVTFIDYGNVTKVTPEDIRHYPDTFTEPCRTTTCLISDLPYEIDEEIAKELRKEIQFPSMKTISKVLSVTDEGYACVLMGLSI